VSYLGQGRFVAGGEWGAGTLIGSQFNPYLAAASTSLPRFALGDRKLVSHGWHSGPTDESYSPSYPWDRYAIRGLPPFFRSFQSGPARGPRSPREVSISVPAPGEMSCGLSNWDDR
jgi:hypothetical protein